MKYQENILSTKNIAKFFLVGIVAAFAFFMDLNQEKNDFRIMAGHWYSVNTAVTGYYSTGACAANCYKLTSGSSYYYQNGASCNATCGSKGSYSGYTACSWYTQKYSYTAATPTTSYNFSGTCNASGSGSCYKSNSTATNYVSGACGSVGCTTGTYNTGATACNWIAQKYSYARSGTTATGYNFSGASVCASDGSGSCYAAGSNYSSWYCGDTACGSAGCTNCSASYYSPTTCTYSTGADQDTATLTQGANDLNQSKTITFWVYSVGRTGSFLQFQMGEAAASEQTFNFSIDSTNTWEQKSWDISAIAVASKDAITKFAFKNLDSTVGSTFYFDDIQAVSTKINSPSACVIKESTNDTSLLPFWVDNSTNENGFQLEKSINGAGFTFLTNLGVNTTGFQDSSISQGNTYTYRIRSYVTDIGATTFSGYCNFPTLNINAGSFKFNGVNMNGIKIN